MSESARPAAETIVAIPTAETRRQSSTWTARQANPTHAPQQRDQRHQLEQETSSTVDAPGVVSPASSAPSPASASLPRATAEPAQTDTDAEEAASQYETRSAGSELELGPTEDTSATVQSPDDNYDAIPALVFASEFKPSLGPETSTDQSTDENGDDTSVQSVARHESGLEDHTNPRFASGAEQIESDPSDLQSLKAAGTSVTAETPGDSAVGETDDAASADTPMHEVVDDDRADAATAIPIKAEHANGAIPIPGEGTAGKDPLLQDRDVEETLESAEITNVEAIATTGKASIAELSINDDTGLSSDASTTGPAGTLQDEGEETLTSPLPSPLETSPNDVTPASHQARPLAYTPARARLPSGLPRASASASSSRQSTPASRSGRSVSSPSTTNGAGSSKSRTPPASLGRASGRQSKAAATSPPSSQLAATPLRPHHTGTPAGSSRNAPAPMRPQHTGTPTRAIERSPLYAPTAASKARARDRASPATSKTMSDVSVQRSTPSPSKGRERTPKENDAQHADGAPSLSSRTRKTSASSRLTQPTASFRAKAQQASD